MSPSEHKPLATLAPIIIRHLAWYVHVIMVPVAIHLGCLVEMGEMCGCGVCGVEGKCVYVWVSGGLYTVYTIEDCTDMCVYGRLYILYIV